MISLPTIIGMFSSAGEARPEQPADLAMPATSGPFIVPSPGPASEPVWGIRGGIALGLWPTTGPRGLFRIYAPYLGQGPRRMINFIAVEPIVDGSRGLSELEMSQRDHVPGKAMWSAEGRQASPEPKAAWDHPARGSIITEGDRQRLKVTFRIERFENGAHPIIEATLHENRPFEVDFQVFSAEDGTPMESCVLSATMGNYARARLLWLREHTADARDLWPDFGPSAGFAPHHRWGIDSMLLADGDAIVAITTDEAEPAQAEYDDKVADHWRYGGRKATQYWRAPADDALAVQANARLTYWASEAAIPGGISFENFELVAPYVPGRSSTFGVTPETPESLGFDRRLIGANGQSPPADRPGDDVDPA